MNLELTRTVMEPKTKLMSRVAVTLFGDAGYTGASRSVGGIGDSTVATMPDRWLADAGLGLRLTHRVGRVTWTSRLDFPLFVSDAQWAFAQQFNRVAANRLVVSFSPVIP